MRLAERGERRRAAGRARRPADRQRAGGRDLVGDGRPGDRRARAAAHVRVGRGGGPAARHRAVRPRHLRRADRAAGGGARRPRLGAGAGVDARHRRRGRLRAADSHALSRRAGGGPHAARRGRGVGRDRGPLGADRRDDRRDLAARAVPDGTPLPLRRRARDDRLGARRDGGLGHAGAGADGDRRERGSSGCGSRAPPAPRRTPTRRRRRAGAAPSSAGRGSPRSPAWRCCWCSPRRSPACASASPTAATTRPTRPRARPTTSSRRASGPARTGRCCWPRRPPASATATRWPRWRSACGASRAWRRSRGRRPAPRATRSC